MKYLPMVAGTNSGSLGGTTYSHNRYGQYVRRKAIPVNPNTARQAVNRSRFSAAVIAWFALTAAQRTAWDTYAANVPVTDSLGQSINLTGQAMYVRSYTAITGALLTAPTDAPVVYNLGDIDPTLTLTAAAEDTNIVGFSFDDTLAWCDEDNAALVLYQTRPQSITRAYNGQPTRRCVTLPGDSVTPPASPETYTATTAAYTLSAGNVIRCAARIIRADGRVSTEFLTNTFTVTAT